MKIAMFTDTYFPQISGVATSIKILKDELEKMGHSVTIFTTTDPDAHLNEQGVVRIASVPFLFFTDRRVAIGGMRKAYQIAKEEQFDLVHTHTEFGIGLIGKYVAYRLKIPTVHTYHTMYEKYLHYIANGHIVKKSHVKWLSHTFCNLTSGVVSPGKQMTNILESYGINSEIRTIPTGVPIPPKNHTIREKLRQQLDISSDEVVLLSLSRVAKEKSIDELIKAMPTILNVHGYTRLVIAGNGPAKEELEHLTKQLNLEECVTFVGEVPHDDVCNYYQMADLYINASQTETQGLTFLESLANGLPVIAKKNDYLSGIIRHKALGTLYDNISELGDTINKYITYLNDRENLTDEQMDALLYEISSTRFAETIFNFYNDASQSYQIKQTNTNNPKSLLNRLYFKNWFTKDKE